MEGYTKMSQSEYARKTKKARSTVCYYVKKGLLDVEVVAGVPYILIPNDGEIPQPSKK